MSILLAIESSCDETSAAVVVNGKVLNNIVASQSVHQAYGGVVPELASRAHQEHIVPVVQQALQQAGLQPVDLDAVAVTQGPGLLGALLVGNSFAKGMALSLGVPLIGVNHMEAHVLAHFISEPAPVFPFLCLTVSGGHTQLLRVQGPGQLVVLGQTLDDAVGEAFDKTAKMMGLPYPGGPQVDKLAQQGKAVYPFPPAQIPGLDFSFSGIKTAVLYFLREQKHANPAFLEHHAADLAASVQQALVDMLLDKTAQAMEQEGLTQLALAGGVAANSGLRRAAEALAKDRGWDIFVPELQHCTDNAAMVAMTAHFQFEQGRFVDLSMSPDPRLQLHS